MARTGLDFYSGNMPGGIWLLAALIAITWFILWFVYRYSGILRLSRVWLVGTVLTLFWFLGYSYLWRQFPPPHERNRVLIISGLSPHFLDAYLDSYLNEIYLYESIKIKAERDKFLTYHPDWPLSIANWDSLRFPAYRAKLIDFMAADYVFIWNQGDSPNEISADLLIRNRSAGFDTIRQAVVRSENHRLDLNLEMLEAFSLSAVDTTIYVSRWPEDVQRIWARGRMAYISGDLASARSEFEESLRIRSDFYPARLELAQLEIDSALIAKADGGYFQQYLSQASQHLDQLVDQDTKDARVARISGEYSILTENFVIAEANLKESYYVEPDNDRLYLDFTHLHPSRYKDLKFLDEEALFRMAVFVNPASVQARIHYSDYLNLKSRPEDSREMLLEILKFNPQHYDANMTLGKLDILQQSYDQALSLYSGMLEMPYSNLAPIKFNLAVAYFHQGKIQDASRIFEELADQNSNPDAFLYLASIREKEGDVDSAIEYLRMRIRNNRGPNDRFKEEARKRLVILLQRQGEAVN